MSNDDRYHPLSEQPIVGESSANLSDLSILGTTSTLFPLVPDPCGNASLVGSPWRSSTPTVFLNFDLQIISLNLLLGYYS